MHSLHQLESPPARRLILLTTLIASLLLILVFAYQARSRQLKKELRVSQGIPAYAVNDFERWMEMVPKFINDRANYEGDNFPTPPITLLIFAPLTNLSVANAQFTWALCKWFFVLGIAWACLRMIATTGIKPTIPALAFAALVWFSPVCGDIQEGQTNLLMLLPLCIGLACAQASEAGALNPEPRTPNTGLQLIAGIWIALAICIKVTPLIFLIYFLWRRRFTISLGILLGIALWLLLIPTLAFGWSQNLTWLHQWFRIMILPYVMHGEVAYYVGQSVPSFITRLLRHVPIFDSQPPHYINLVDLPPQIVNWIIRAILGSIGLTGLYWMRRRLTSTNSPRYLLEIGAVAIFMLWASERTWVPHYVSIALAAAAAAMVLSDPAESPRFRRRAAWMVLLAAGFMLMTTDIAKIFGRYGGEWMRTFGVSLWASLLLILVIARSRFGRDASRPMKQQNI